MDFFKDVNHLYSGNNKPLMLKWKRTYRNGNNQYLYNMHHSQLVFIDSMQSPKFQWHSSQNKILKFVWKHRSCIDKEMLNIKTKREVIH